MLVAWSLATLISVLLLKAELVFLTTIGLQALFIFLNNNQRASASPLYAELGKVPTKSTKVQIPVLGRNF